MRCEARRTVGQGIDRLVSSVLAFAVAGAAWGQSSSGLSVEVRGLRNDHGQVLCYLYPSAAGFPGDAARATERIAAPIAGRAATCRFQGLAPGQYAVAVVHDENNNGRLDRNLLGIPNEGVGASNSPTSHFGPPGFDQARFNYAGGPATITVQVHYL